MERIEEAELDELNQLKTKLANVITEVGQQQLELELLKLEIENVQQKINGNTSIFKDLLVEEQDIINRLSSKYGAGTINFETGEFVREK